MLSNISRRPAQKEANRGHQETCSSSPVLHPVTVLLMVPPDVFVPTVPPLCGAIALLSVTELLWNVFSLFAAHA